MRIVVISISSIFILAGSARAQPASDPATSASKSRGAIVAAKIGGIVPFDGLSPYVSAGLEGGYAFGPLVVVLDVDYTQPTKTGTEMDPRVDGGTYSWKLTERELAFMPLIEYRLTGMSVVPYAGIGPRLLLARSMVQSEGQPTISATEEQSTRLGVGIPVGAEIAFGPGTALGELLLQYGSLDHTATGDANTSAVTFSIGYRMTF